MVTSPVQAKTVTVDDYWQQLEDIRTLVRQLAKTSPPNSAQQLQDAANQLVAITAIEMSDGTLVPIDHSYLLARMRADPPALDEIEALLNAALDAHERWPNPEMSVAASNILQNILARSEFQWPEPRPSPIQEWLDDLNRQRLENANQEATVVTVDTSYFDMGVVILIAIVTVAVLIYMFPGFFDNFILDAELDHQGDDFDENLTSEQALNRAQTLSNHGNYRSAVRYLYLSTLLILEERGLLRYDRTMTNREYLQSVSHVPQLATSLRSVIDVFDRVWYGYQPLSEAEYNHYATQVTKLKRQKQ